MKFHEIPIEFTTFHIVSFWSVLHCPKGESIWSIIIYFFAIKFSPQPLWKRNRTSSNLWLKSFPKVKLWSRFGRSCSNPSTQLEFHYQRFGRVASRVTASPKRQQRQKTKCGVLNMSAENLSLNFGWNVNLCKSSGRCCNWLGSAPTPSSCAIPSSDASSSLTPIRNLQASCTFTGA